MASNKKKSNEQARTALTTKSGLKSKKAHPQEVCDMHRYMKQHPLLAQLVQDDEALFQCDGEAPSPSKDYGQLQITLNKVILRWWKITLRNIEGSKYPGEIKDSYEDFYNDEVAQREIWRIFGQRTLDYCIGLVCGQVDWLARLPPKLQLHILSYVNLEDIPEISLVSKSFRMLCRDNDLWKRFYVRHYGQHALDNRDLVHLAERRGWRHVFFTNRLKLQMQLRREAQLSHHHQDDPSDLIKARARRSNVQPSPPASPRLLNNLPPPSVRRHSFATRQETISLSSLRSTLPYQEDSLSSARSYMNETPESPRPGRPPSPASSTRSNAGSVASTASAHPPVRSSHRSTNHH